MLQKCLTISIRSKSDVTKRVTNLIQNTNSPNIKNLSADPFWEKAERMFLESLFLYVWMECPKGVYNQKRGRAELLQKNWKTILYLLDEAQFVDADTPPKLDLRMEELAKKKPDHPAVKAYQRYRGGPDETIRSVIMTVNARMQPFDNEELLEIFSSNDIPLDEFGVGIDGDKKTKSNLFIIIPDDDDTFNFVPGMVYTLLFQALYRQARFFGGKLPMDVGVFCGLMATLIGGFTYATKYRINPVDSSVSPDGKYELLFQQIGDPEWPFGSTHARLVLRDESGIITKYPFYVLNDGCSVHQDSWKVTWTDTYVKVVISGEEQNDDQYILYFDGKEDFKQREMKRGTSEE